MEYLQLTIAILRPFPFEFAFVITPLAGSERLVITALLSISLRDAVFVFVFLSYEPKR